MRLIILAGMPATGKSTLAKKLQAHFGFPILEKDGLKETLFDTIGFVGYPAKRQLDVAANALLLQMMRTLIQADVSMIVDNNFDEESAEKLRQLIAEYTPNVATIFLSGDPQVLYERYVARDSAGLRHLGHAMQTNYPPHEGESTVFFMSREGFDERFVHRKMDCLSWDGMHIRLDATIPEQIDADDLIDKIEKAFGGSES